MHSKTESNKKALKEKTEHKGTSKHQPITPSPTALAPDTAGVAISPSSSIQKDDQPLIDQLADILENTVQTPLCHAVSVETWLRQAWIEPVQPHTPAWTFAISGRVSPRDLVALILAIWADRSIKHPARYLSWLIQRWQTMPETPPVDQWDQWRKLAGMTLENWLYEGRQIWIELAPREDRSLPFGLDTLVVGDNPAQIAKTNKKVQDDSSPVMEAEAVEASTSNGLDERPGDGWLTIGDIWTAALGQLSLQLNRATYTSWLEGTKAVSYADGVLTVCARHGVACDLLAELFNSSIEGAVSLMAQTPIKIRYIASPPRYPVPMNPLLDEVDQPLKE